MNENTPGKTAEAIYLPLKEASKVLGLPVYYLRRGVKEKRFPCQVIGEKGKYYLNIPATRRILAQTDTGGEGGGLNEN